MQTSLIWWGFVAGNRTSTLSSQNIRISSLYTSSILGGFATYLTTAHPPQVPNSEIELKFLHLVINRQKSDDVEKIQI